MNRFFYWLCTLTLLTTSACQEKEHKGATPIPKVVFEEQLVPSDKVELFMPGVVSIRDVVHFNSSFSDDGKYLTYTITAKGKPGTVVTQTFENGTFSPPLPLHEDTVFSYSDPHISGDGNSIILASNRPHFEGDSTNRPSSLWQFQREENSWKNPSLISFDMGFEGGFGYPCLTADKTLYFQYMPDDGSRNMDIYRSEFKNGQYQAQEKLPPHINTEKFEGDAFIDRQERFMIFAGFDREPNYGLSDLYITFKLDQGWSKAVNLGEEINSHGYDGSPFVTPDDQYLIFTSSRHPEKAGEQEYFNLFYVKFDLEKFKHLATDHS